jgi:hypothetical protein
LITRHLKFHRYFVETNIFAMLIIFLHLITRHLNLHRYLSKTIFLNCR